MSVLATAHTSAPERAGRDTLAGLAPSAPAGRGPQTGPGRAGGRSETEGASRVRLSDEARAALALREDSGPGRDASGRDAPDLLERIATRVIVFFYRALGLDVPDPADPEPLVERPGRGVERGMRDAMDLLVAFGERERAPEPLAAGGVRERGEASAGSA
ncbi:MAG: hypothetical protein OEP95_05610 [Myxococcales bacterium]|nr:hypothetical protein [Myxococcales bacterium]